MDGKPGAFSLQYIYLLYYLNIMYDKQKHAREMLYVNISMDEIIIE